MLDSQKDLTDTTMKMTESSSLSQDKPGNVEKPGAGPGSLPPPLGRDGEPGGKRHL